MFAIPFLSLESLILFLYICPHNGCTFQRATISTHNWVSMHNSERCLQFFFVHDQQRNRGTRATTHCARIMLC